MASWFLTRFPRTLNGEKVSLQQMVLGQLDTHIKKNEVELSHHTTHLTKWINDLNLRAKL